MSAFSFHHILFHRVHLPDDSNSRIFFDVIRIVRTVATEANTFHVDDDVIHINIIKPHCEN